MSKVTNLASFRIGYARGLFELLKLVVHINFTFLTFVGTKDKPILDSNKGFRGFKRK
jgi:hypothetical protein